VGVLDEVAEDGLVVVADEEDFGDLGDSGDSIEAVLDDGLAGHFEEGLFGARQTGSRYQDEALIEFTLGTSRDSGRKRVPLLGPPTCVVVSAAV
jgi:hypothetical protein